MAEIEQLCANNGQIESTEQIQNVVLFLQTSEDLSGHLESFLQLLSSSQPRDDLSFALTPLLSQHRCVAFLSYLFSGPFVQIVRL